MITNLFEYPVYVINLDRRPDRWQQISKMLRASGFQNIYRIPAIDGKKIDTTQIQTLVDPAVFKTLGKKRNQDEDLGSVGAIGCYLSHYKVWRTIVESGKPGIVIEDDLLVIPSLNKFEIVGQPEKFLRGYDIVLLANLALRDKTKRNFKVGKFGVYPYDGMFFGLHFYYLTPQGALKFLNSPDIFPLKYQVDSFMGIAIKTANSSNNLMEKINMGVHVPSLGIQSGSSTDIQTPIQSGLSVFVNSVSQSPSQCIPFIILIILVVILIFIFIIDLYKFSNKIHPTSA